MLKRITKISFVCLLLINMISISGLIVEINHLQNDSVHQFIPNTKEELAKNAMEKLRSSFIENQGQISNNEVIFYGHLLNGMIGFSESEIKLWMEGMNAIITLEFVGAYSVSPVGIDELETKTNYFYGDRGTYTNVRSYGTIFYTNLWEGIDLYYYATLKGAKYEFHVAPGANPEDIRINCDGQEQLIIEKDTITFLNKKGCFVDEGLIAFQGEVKVDAEFLAKEDNIFGFQLSGYDQEKLLVIDPLLYSTLIGGNDSDSGSDIILDESENMIVVGTSSSPNFPTTAEALNGTNNSMVDCIVFKLSANGQNLLYSTFIGGSDEDFAKRVRLDNAGNIYVTGDTYSTDFPTTTDTLNETYNGGFSDCFVFKLAENGSMLLFSTYIGGAETDRGTSIVLDLSVDIWVSGYTHSTDFPTTANAYDQTYNGTGECFVLKLSNNGSKLLYSTFVGGNSSEHGFDMAIDASENIYVTGITYSDDFPTTIGVFDDSYNDYWDCFVFKLSADGSTLLYSTYVGGTRDDYGYALALDSNNNAYVTGYLRSEDFPTTIGTYDDSFNGLSWDSYVFKLSADGSSLLYSTYIGGEDSDYGLDITTDNQGNAYVTGNTHSGNFPTTSNAYDKVMDDWEGYIFKLSADGTNLLYSTFFGGYESDSIRAITLNTEGHAFVTGSTYSSNFPTTTNAYNETHSGMHDCFISEFLIEDAPPPSTTPPTSPSPTDTETIDAAISLLVPVVTLFIAIPIIILVRRKKSEF